MGRVVGLVVLGLFFRLFYPVAGLRVVHRAAIRTHKHEHDLSLLEEPSLSEKVNDQNVKDSAANETKPLNLIFSPTAQQVSDENGKLLESVESGLHNLRNSFNILTKLIHLLQEEDKQSSFVVDKETYTISGMLDSLDKLISDGEKQQRILIQGTAELLHKLAVPTVKSQTVQPA